MIEIQFQVEINASKERVWATLWEDKTFRDWANIILVSRNAKKSGLAGQKVILLPK